MKKVPVKEGESKVVAEAVSSDAPITNHEYQLPPLSLLNQPKKKQKETDEASIEKNIETLERVLKILRLLVKLLRFI